VSARTRAATASSAPSLARAARDLVALVKPGIMVNALLTAVGAMALAPGVPDTRRALLLVLGSALIVGAANTLNMYLERDTDCMMSRTRNRPLPQGRLEAATALWFGAVLGVLSLPPLFAVNALTGVLGLVALASYVLVYTPLKRRTHWAAWVGAVPGALPVLMGWAAATGGIDAAGLSIFAVLFFWQIPHFHAIAMYRQREYENAGLKTLPGQHGVPAARAQIGVFLVVQVAASIAVALTGVTGTPYLIVAIALGAVVLAQGLPGVRRGDVRWARRLFLLSLVYLPLLFITMVLDGRL
jgi:protoheme IX farnesyltransferase